MSVPNGRRKWSVNVEDSMPPPEGVTATRPRDEGDALR
jgi:hypothetical protein